MIKNYNVFFFLFLNSCVFGFTQGKILELQDVQHFDLEILSESDPLTIKISGLAFHSALAVKDMRLEKKEHEIQIMIFLSLAKKGMSGSFEYVLQLPHDIDIVTFGKESKVIWNRDS